MARHNKDMAYFNRGILYLPDGERIPATNSSINGGLKFEINPRWVMWLDQNNRFAFDDLMGGSFTARKEKRRNGAFWYAFATVNDKTVKRYIGKEVTTQRLTKVGWEFRQLRAQS